MISVDWTLGLQFVNFVVLMTLLNAILFRPLRKMLDERRGTIEGSHGKAKELEGQIAERMTRYQEQLQEARNKAGQENAAIRQEAAKAEAETLGAAQEKASDKLKAIKNKVAAEAQEVRESLKKETETLSKEIASKVLGRAV